LFTKNEITKFQIN